MLKDSAISVAKTQREILFPVYTWNDGSLKNYFVYLLPVFNRKQKEEGYNISNHNITVFMLIFHGKHTHIYIYTLPRLWYPRESLQFFTSIPGSIWTIQQFKWAEWGGMGEYFSSEIRNGHVLTSEFRNFGMGIKEPTLVRKNGVKKSPELTQAFIHLSHRYALQRRYRNRNCDRILCGISDWKFENAEFRNRFHPRHDLAERCLT